MIIFDKKERDNITIQPLCPKKTSSEQWKCHYQQVPSDHPVRQTKKYYTNKTVVVQIGGAVRSQTEGNPGQTPRVQKQVWIGPLFWRT